MNVIKSILGSDHGLLAVLLIIAATVLTALGIMPLADWESYSKIIFGTFAATHAVITGVALATHKQALPDKPAVASVAPATNASQAGYIVAPAILFLTVIGSCIGIIAILSCATPCDPSSIACAAQNGLVTCAQDATATGVAQAEPIVDQTIFGATNAADGSVDWASIEGTLEADALKFGACVIAAIFDHLISDVEVAQAGAHKRPTPDAARDGFNRLRVKLWPGKTFKLSTGRTL